MAAPTTRTILQIQQDVLSRLSENANSTVASLPTGTDNTATEDTPTAIRRYINEGARRLARAGYPLYASGTFAGINGTAYIPLSKFDCGDGSGLFAVRALKVGTAVAYRTNRSTAEINTSSTRQLWVPEGQAGVSLSPGLTSSQTVTAQGYAVPPLKMADADTFDWLGPDLDYLLVDYAAAEVCRKAAPQDEVLGGLANVWSARFEAGALTLNLRLKAADPALWAAHFAYPLPGGK